MGCAKLRTGKYCGGASEFIERFMYYKNRNWYAVHKIQKFLGNYGRCKIFVLKFWAGRELLVGSRLDKAREKKAGRERLAFIG